MVGVAEAGAPSEDGGGQQRMLLARARAAASAGPRALLVGCQRRIAADSSFLFKLCVELAQDQVGAARYNVAFGANTRQQVGAGQQQRHNSQKVAF